MWRIFPKWSLHELHLKILELKLSFEWEGSEKWNISAANRGSQLISISFSNVKSSLEDTEQEPRN